MKFEDLHLAPAILDSVYAQGYTAPTPIQEQAIPLVLAGNDLLAGAQTGTGKTAAFTLPMLHILSGREAKQANSVRALVLCPTRELAAQVEDSVRIYGTASNLKSTAIFGGVGMNPQIQRIAKGIDILVATPGRLLDLHSQGVVDLSGVEMLVLDEADRMLDMGFIHDVKKILAVLPAEKQSLLFSATFSDEISALAHSLLRDPKQVQVTPPNTTVQRINQAIHPVGRNKKKELLAHIIQQNDWKQVLVFTRTKFGANKVADFLNKQGITAMALHGNKSQSARTMALADFKSGALQALIATDIAARGIDIDDLPHVVNYDIPNIAEDYVHRIGRTGRAGAQGQAVSFVSLDEEGFMHSIERFIRQQISVQIIAGFEPEPDEKAEPIAMGRQTLWGGAGKPPSREVMQAAARAARQEMMQRMRENRKPKKQAKTSEANSNAETPRPVDADGNPLPSKPHQPRARTRRNRFRSVGGNNRNHNQTVTAATGEPRKTGENPSRRNHANNGKSANKRNGNHNSSADAQPKSHESALFKSHRDEFNNSRNKSKSNTSANNQRQPDPLRTSVDGLRRSSRGGNTTSKRRY